MRTTIEIDDDLHEIARRRAFDERRSLGSVISELAKSGLAREVAGPTSRRPLGRFAGLIHIADDFDATPPDVLTSLDQPLQ